MRYGLAAEPGLLGANKPVVDSDTRNEIQMLVNLLPDNVQEFLQTNSQLQEVCVAPQALLVSRPACENRLEELT